MLIVFYVPRHNVQCQRRISSRYDSRNYIITSNFCMLAKITFDIKVPPRKLDNHDVQTRFSVFAIEVVELRILLIETLHIIELRIKRDLQFRR